MKNRSPMTTAITETIGTPSSLIEVVVTFTETFIPVESTELRPQTGGVVLCRATMAGVAMATTPTTVSAPLMTKVPNRR